MIVFVALLLVSLVAPTEEYVAYMFLNIDLTVLENPQQETPHPGLTYKQVLPLVL